MANQNHPRSITSTSPRPQSDPTCLIPDTLTMTTQPSTAADDQPPATVAARPGQKTEAFYKANPGRQILIRVRPLTETEGSIERCLTDEHIVSGATELHLYPLPSDSHNTSPEVSMAHHVFGPSSTNSDMCVPLKPMMQASLELHEDFCVLLDGQSGSGKT